MPGFEEYDKVIIAEIEGSHLHIEFNMGEYRIISDGELSYEITRRIHALLRLGRLILVPIGPSYRVTGLR